MRWNFVRTGIALLLLVLVPLALAQTESSKARIGKVFYDIPENEDVCIYFDWEAVGALDQNLQLTLRAMRADTGDFIFHNGIGTKATVDSSGLLSRKLDVVVPYDHTEWFESYMCLPITQFPEGDYSWYPVLSVFNTDTQQPLLMRIMRDIITFENGIMTSAVAVPAADV